ncbi:MAG: hypothetical protein ACTHLY_09370, partial [Pseudolabrys sp.]
MTFAVMTFAVVAFAITAFATPTTTSAAAAAVAVAAAMPGGAFVIADANRFARPGDLLTGQLLDRIE